MISEDRKKDINDSHGTFFAETENGRRVPRAIYVDLEPTVIGEFNFIALCEMNIFCKIRFCLEIFAESCHLPDIQEFC